MANKSTHATAVLLTLLVSVNTLTERGGNRGAGDGSGGDMKTVSSGRFVGGQIGRQLQQTTGVRRQLENVGRIALGRSREQQPHLVHARASEELHLRTSQPTCRKSSL